MKSLKFNVPSRAIFPFASQNLFKSDSGSNDMILATTPSFTDVSFRNVSAIISPKVERWDFKAVKRFKSRACNFCQKSYMLVSTMQNHRAMMAYIHRSDSFGEKLGLDFNESHLSRLQSLLTLDVLLPLGL